MKVSIITPTFNRLEFLKECVESVRLSIVKPLDIQYEHVVCNVGSTDGTGEWLKQAATRDKHLKVINHDIQLPPSQARNLAIKQSTGDWLLPLDDDDLMLQRTIYNFVSLATEHPDNQWFGCDFLHMTQEGRYIMGDDYYSWRFSSPADMLQAIFSGGHFIQGNVMYSRRLFDQVGRYDEQMKDAAEDIDLYIRFIKQAGLPVVGTFISHLHRFHQHNISQGITQAKHQAMMDILARKYQA